MFFMIKSPFSKSR